ncbi:MAG: hypothetical protein QXN55_05640 [Candidatus Nitrosotenuis sp.]
MNTYEIPQEDAERLEVVCGFCEKIIRIRSLAEHVKSEHSTSFLSEN